MSFPVGSLTDCSFPPDSVPLPPRWPLLPTPQPFDPVWMVPSAMALHPHQGVWVCTKGVDGGVIAIFFVGDIALVHFQRILRHCVYIIHAHPGVCGLHHVHNVHVNCSPLTFYLKGVKSTFFKRCVCVQSLAMLDGFLFFVVMVTTSYAM